MPVLTTESATVICQRALGLAECRNRFTSLEDGSAEAREARLRYDARRRSVLDALDWGFARRRAAGAAVVEDATPPDLPAAWAIPPECLRIRAVHAGGRPLHYLREGRIFTPQVAAVQIVFTRDVHNPVLFPSPFTQALEFLLASEFAMIFARSINRADAMLTYFRSAMQEADTAEAAERANGGDAYAAGPWVGAVACPWMEAG